MDIYGAVIVAVIVTVIVVVVLAMIYFLPTTIALIRGCTKSTIIGVLNFIFGWTGILWLFCLIWAIVDENKSQRIERERAKKMQEIQMQQQQTLMQQMMQQMMKMDNTQNYNTINDVVNGEEVNIVQNDGIKKI